MEYAAFEQVKNGIVYYIGMYVYKYVWLFGSDGGGAGRTKCARHARPHSHTRPSNVEWWMIYYYRWLLIWVFVIDLKTPVCRTNHQISYFMRSVSRGVCVFFFFSFFWRPLYILYALHALAIYFSKWSHSSYTFCLRHFCMETCRFQLQPRTHHLNWESRKMRPNFHQLYNEIMVAPHHKENSFAHK